MTAAASHPHEFAEDLVGKGATPSISGMFCKAVIHLTLLHGCELWVLTDKVWNIFESFHNGAA